MAAKLPLCIIKQPSPKIISQYFGSRVSISVSADGIGTLTYQWMKDKKPLADKECGPGYDGALSSTLLIRSLRPTHQGSYTCHVYNKHTTVCTKPVKLKGEQQFKFYGEQI